MKILNFGSLNINHVYGVDHFVRPGETLASKRYQRFSGGKGNIPMSTATVQTIRPPTGTQEWAASNVNIQDGCEHDCR